MAQHIPCNVMAPSTTAPVAVLVPIAQRRIPLELRLATTVVASTQYVSGDPINTYSTLSPELNVANTWRL